MLHRVNRPRLLYPFIWRWAFRPCPRLGSCEPCCSEHGAAEASSRRRFHFLQMNTPRSGIAGSRGSSIANFLRNLRPVSHSGWAICSPTGGARGFPFLHTPFLLCLVFLATAVLAGASGRPAVVAMSPPEARSPRRSARSHCRAVHLQNTLASRNRSPTPRKQHPLLPHPGPGDHPVSLSLTALGNSRELGHPVCVLL